MADAPSEGQSGDSDSDFVWTVPWHAGVNNLSESLKQWVALRLGEAGSVADAVARALWQRAEAVGYAQHFEAVAQNLLWRPALEDEANSVHTILYGAGLSVKCRFCLGVHIANCGSDAVDSLWMLQLFSKLRQQRRTV